MLLIPILVEAPGVEPGSEKAVSAPSTSVAAGLIFAWKTPFGRLPPCYLDNLFQRLRELPPEHPRFIWRPCSPPGWDRFRRPL